jgi:hypothetical protein
VVALAAVERRMKTIVGMPGLGDPTCANGEHEDGDEREISLDHVCLLRP